MPLYMFMIDRDRASSRFSTFPQFLSRSVDRQHHLAYRVQSFRSRSASAGCDSAYRNGPFGGTHASGLRPCVAASLLQAIVIRQARCSRISGRCPCGSCLLIAVSQSVALIGFVNGFFAAKFKLHPFIVTLATQLIVFGVASDVPHDRRQ